MRTYPSGLKLRQLTPLILSGLLGACAVGPVYERPATEMPVQWPAALASQMPSADVQSQWQHWWQHYQDPGLNALIATALDNNLQLRLQADRIREARAVLGLRQAQRWPSLAAQLDVAREQQPQITTFNPLAGAGAYNQFSVAAVLSYEIDLWGRIEQQQDAAMAMLEQSVYGGEAVRLNLIADIVTTYVNLQSAYRQVTLAERYRESREQTLALEQLRYDAGVADRFGVAQARAALEATRALLPDLYQQVALTETALAVLVGRSPAEILESTGIEAIDLEAVHLPDQLPAMLPSQLLERRPDIRAAEAALIAATAEQGISEAQRLPAINLTTLLGSAALGSASNLFSADAQTWSAGLSAAGPLFDMGRSRRAIEAAAARRDQAETQYQLTVQSALRDVRDALTLYTTSEQRSEALRNQTEAVQDMLTLARQQYDEGMISFYELLEYERSLLDAQLSLTQSTASQLAATATLFKALGGGWE